MKFNIINSGSKGNATIVCHKNTTILIDMGVTLKTLEDGLNKFNLKVSDISAAIFTHNHCDHIKGIKFLSPKIMYALEGTLPSSLSNVIELNKPFIINDIKITAFSISHDAINPCGYVLEADDEKLVYMTDTGIFLEENLPLLKNPTYLIIESNHDIKMLLNTDRTYELKSRILSSVGHLCNEDSAIATCAIIGDDTKEIYLAHISEEANAKELAIEAYKKIFNYYRIKFDDYIIKCTDQRINTIGGKDYEN